MKMLVPLKLALIPLLAMPLLGGCSSGGDESGGPTPALDEANLTVEEVYRRFAEAINRPGYVYRSTVNLDHKGGYFRMEGTRTFWADAARDLARDEYDTRITHEEGARDYNQAAVIANGAEYTPSEQTEGGSQPGSKIEARKCYGVNAAVSAILGCPGWTEESTKKAEIGKYRGRAAVILITTGARHGEDETTTFTEKLYLDRRTLLPVALEGEGTLDYGKIYPVSWLYKFENDFVPADTLPGDFFDPTSIGYAEPDPEAALVGSDLGMTVYWLGSAFEGAGALPPLSLTNVVVPTTDRLYKVMLDYNLASDPFGSRALMLQEYDLDRWNDWMAESARTAASRVPGNWWDWPCRDREELTLPNGGRATIVLGYESDTERVNDISRDKACPLLPYDHFMAHVYLGSTVVMVDAPGMISPDGTIVESPYDSVAGMEAIARALQPRQ